LELQAQLAAAQLQAQLDRQALEEKLQEAQAQLQHERFLRNREPRAVHAASLPSRAVSDSGLQDEYALCFSLLSWICLQASCSVELYGSLHLHQAAHSCQSPCVRLTAHCIACMM
jgi:hypothetical protein